MDRSDYIRTNEPAPFLVVQLHNTDCAVWVDSSFLDQDKNKSGSGILVTDPDDRYKKLLVQSFNTSQLNLKRPGNSELWGVVLALEQLNDFHIKRLTYDCGTIGHRINDIRNGTLDTERFNGELFDRLTKAVNHHSDMETNQVKRSNNYIHVADVFSRAAAKDLMANLINHVKSFKIPCLYHILDGKGSIERTSFIPPPQDLNIPTAE